MLELILYANIIIVYSEIDFLMRRGVFEEYSFPHKTGERITAEADTPFTS